MSAARPTRPTFMTSGPVADALASALWDYATRLEAEQVSAPVASQIRLVRRSARELLAVHDIPGRPAGRRSGAGAGGVLMAATQHRKLVQTRALERVLLAVCVALAAASLIVATATGQGAVPRRQRGRPSAEQEARGPVVVVSDFDLLDVVGAIVCLAIVVGLVVLCEFERR